MEQSDARLHSQAPVSEFPRGRAESRHCSGRREDGTTEGVFAAIDLGTNNCRLMIAARTNAGFSVLDSYSRMVRLGEGLQKSGELTEEAMGRTVEAVRACAVRIEKRRPALVRAVATEACRRATNGRAFIDRIRRETGVVIDIISSREEAALAVESCASLLLQARGGQGEIAVVPAANRGLLLDIGGGSTEIAWVRLDPERRTHEVIGYVSIPAGVITLSEKFSRRRPGVYRAMVSYVRKYLENFEAVHRIRGELQRGNVRMVGTSGTVTTLACLDLDLARYTRWAVDGHYLDRQASQKAISRLHRMGISGMRAHPCIGPERAAYVMPGCAIFDAVQSMWPGGVIVADRGLRDGMLIRMMKGAAQATIRRNGPDRATPADVSATSGRETLFSI
ncbi:exopolyphosphatase [Acetobacter nitrogenifigens DSM 23921 = NBRC 105050]|uniref:Exopolyphosphatase GppA n=1 Tax=Acetobacter nitrogenifigens DSM 23921 = NBRC 105050 TaxID=1120919 RepID=A0A511X9Z5_9PROT|nr:Ppx/GppA phosphatase family protein [Acetobacter nitrogenifigens]GBQ97894.1 exopolyphosphatase [Acetobacter nitrogenifigens DSM 23921 = NBRC 105050]GEN59768.1 exopolyphosphatase GppA [Acetobacter nitrogenifigens DSM 23921 = NBRC 105050]